MEVEPENKTVVDLRPSQSLGNLHCLAPPRGAAAVVLLRRGLAQLGDL